jgi:hypothetical protein
MDQARLTIAPSCRFTQSGRARFLTASRGFIPDRSLAFMASNSASAKAGSVRSPFPIFTLSRNAAQVSPS